MYDDDDKLMDGAKMLVSKGIHVNEVFSPMPIHGIDDVIGVRHTRLGIAAFLYGLTGLMLATLAMKYFMIDDWNMNIGGKPNFALPAWIPITFELTVLCAAVGMVLTFCYICQLSPFLKRHHFHPRATDDLFVMVIECSEKANEEDLKSFLVSVGAQEVNTQIAEEGWWIGKYDEEQELYKESNIA